MQAQPHDLRAVSNVCQQKIQRGLRPLLQILHIFVASNFRLEPRHGSYQKAQQNISKYHIISYLKVKLPSTAPVPCHLCLHQSTVRHPCHLSSPHPGRGIIQHLAIEILLPLLQPENEDGFWLCLH